ncbi:hypothetical protein G6F22_014536 [Rhizopus arrhizus]|nr:hypothetical protein G6F22_014536 [Rhizopus arrhizus]
MPANIHVQQQQQQNPLNQSNHQEKGEQKTVTKKDHSRNTSKTFNAFLQDTNDEWSDDIQNVASLGTSKVVPQEIETVSIPDSTKKKKKKPTNPNGIKEYVQDLLLDPTFLLKWLDIEETKDPARAKKFKDVLSVSNVDLGIY